MIASPSVFNIAYYTMIAVLVAAVRICDNPAMKPEYLYAFYEYTLLPQFDIESEEIGWQKSIEIGPDETAHFFFTLTHSFVLIFEDYDGLGRDPSFIEETLSLKDGEYIFVSPKVDLMTAPSIHFIPQTSYKYAPGITGTFTLLRLLQNSGKNTQDLLHTGVKNDNSWVCTFHQEKV
jgi:hypothetical protein